MTNFPDMSFNQPDIDYYNERTKNEYVQTRGFLILHYKAATRDDSALWNLRTRNGYFSVAREVHRYL